MFLNYAPLFSGDLYGHIRVLNEAKRIYKVLLSSEKIDKNLGGRLELSLRVSSPILSILTDFNNVTPYIGFHLLKN